MCYLIHRRGSLLTCALRIRHNDHSLGHPIVGLLAAPGLWAYDAKFALQLLDKAVLGVALVEDAGPQLAPDQALAVHGVHVGRLLGASDHRLELREVQVGSGWRGTPSP